MSQEGLSLHEKYKFVFENWKLKYNISRKSFSVSSLISLHTHKNLIFANTLHGKGQINTLDLIQRQSA